MASSFKPLELTTKKNSEEIVYLSKMYAAYNVRTEARNLLKAGADHKLEKTHLMLNEQEVNELNFISSQALVLIPDATTKVENYFGTTGRLTGGLEIDQPAAIDSTFFLSLIRSSQQVDTSISIKNVRPPIPLQTLLDNFWSYFVSINSERLKPEDLIFLYEDSLLPVPQTEESKAIDKQARQFLLAAASAQRIGKPVDLANDAVKNLQEHFNSAGNTQMIPELLGSINLPQLQSKFNEIPTSLNELKVVVKTESIGEENIELPDVSVLASDTRRVQMKVKRFVESLEDVIAEGEKLIRENKEKNVALRESIRNIKNSIQKKTVPEKMQ